MLHHIGMAKSRKRAYDTLNAFEYADLASTDLKGLIDYKGQRGTATVANAGIGEALHLCGLMPIALDIVFVYQ